MAVPCIMFLHSGRFAKGSYDVGWIDLSQDKFSDKFILVWGNSKDKETTNKLAENMIKERGERLILRYNKEIGVRSKAGVIVLTDETISDILHGDATEILHQG